MTQRKSPLTVAVTGANSLVGQMLLPRLKEYGHRVVALTRKADTVTVADQVVPAWLNADAARHALHEAGAIVHLSGEIQAKDWSGYYGPNVRTTEIVADALRHGSARHVVFITYPGADPNSDNLFLRAKGQAEQLLLNSGKEAVIFRAQAIINTPQAPGPAEQALIVSPGKTVQTLGRGDAPIETVYRPDVVNAVLAALTCGKAGMYDLTGPDHLTMDGLIRLLNRNPNVRIAHTPKWLAQLMSRFMPDLPPAFADLYFRNYPRMDGARAAEEFGFTFTSLKTVWE